MWPNPQETADLVTFTEEIFNGELRFLCSGSYSKFYQIRRKLKKLLQTSFFV